MSLTAPGADAPAPNRPDAEAMLRAKLDADPAQHTPALLLGDLLLGNGRVDEAVALLWLHTDDRDCGDLLREHFIGERLIDDAQRLLVQRGSDASASGLVDQAIANHLRGDLNGAMTCCRLAQSANPDYAPAYNHLGRALFNARRTAAARAELVHAVRVAPDYAEAWHNLAHVLRDGQEFEQAERAYGHALRLRPAYRSALLNLGIVLVAMRRPEEALGSFQQLLAIDTTHAEAWFNLALCEHILLRYDDARRSYERATMLDPRNPRVPLQQGRLSNDLSDADSALKLFRSVLDLNPREAEAWSEIAMVHNLRDQLDDADRAIAAGLAVAPGDAGLRLEQANIARRRGEYDTALSGLRAIDPQALQPHLRTRYQQTLDTLITRLGGTSHGA